MSATVTRNEAVSADAKVKAYIQGKRDGKTNGQIAAELGMKESSFSVSISQLKKKFKADAAAKLGTGVTVVNPFDSVKSVRKSSKSNVFDNAELIASLNEVDVNDEDSTDAS